MYGSSCPIRQPGAAERRRYPPRGMRPAAILARRGIFDERNPPFRCHHSVAKNCGAVKRMETKRRPRVGAILSTWRLAMELTGTGLVRWPIRAALAASLGVALWSGDALAQQSSGGGGPLSFFNAILTGSISRGSPAAPSASPTGALVQVESAPAGSGGPPPRGGGGGGARPPAPSDRAVT